MELSYDILEAMIKDIQWRNKVAELFGYEWDNEGSHLINTIWGSINDRWGDLGCEFVSDYINSEHLGGNRPYIKDADNKIIAAVNIPSLIVILDKYFLVNGSDEED